jgi:flagellar hook-associated protein 2
MTTTSATSSTSTASSTASIISTLGSGSGIDTGALVTSLVSAQFALKEDALTAKGTKLTAQVSGVGQLQSNITGFATALSQLVKGGTLSTSPTTSDSSVLSVTGLSGASLAGLSASIEVKQLAAAQSAATAPVADPTASVGTGTLTLTLGTATVANGAMTSFTAGSAAPVAIRIDPAHSSLQDIAKAINAAGAGVTASILSDADGARLVLKGATGASQAFTLSATEDTSAPGLSALNIGPGATGTTIGSSAQDAIVALDGVSLKRSSNSIGDLIPGVQMNLLSASPGKIVTIGASRPTAAISQAVTDLVDTFNQVLGIVNTETAAQGGDLSQDSGAQALKRQLGQLTLKPLIASTGDGAPTTLAQIGVATNRDGTLTVNVDQLASAMAKWPDQVEAMFADGTTTGVSAAINAISTAATDKTTGLGASLTKYTAAQSALADAQSANSDAEDAMRTQLTQQFASMDAKVASYKSTQDFLKQQVDAWNNSNNN